MSAPLELFAFANKTFSCVYPFFENIPQVKWYTFSGTSHMSNVEDPKRYMEVVSQFLLNK